MHCNCLPAQQVRATPENLLPRGRCAMSTLFVSSSQMSALGTRMIRFAPSCAGLRFVPFCAELRRGLLLCFCSPADDGLVLSPGAGKLKTPVSSLPALAA